MELASIARYITESFPGVAPVSAWGELSFFYNPGRRLPRGVYFATLKDKDGENDRASNLQRHGVFRLNIGIDKATYRSLFGPRPARPAAGGVVSTGHDFTALDRLMPHPVYGWMSWVAVLNPGRATFESVKPLLEEGYGLAVGQFDRRATCANRTWSAKCRRPRRFSCPRQGSRTPESRILRGRRVCRPVKRLMCAGSRTAGSRELRIPYQRPLSFACGRRRAGSAASGSGHWPGELQGSMHGRIDCLVREAVILGAIQERLNFPLASGTPAS